MERFTDRGAVVTGAASRIGLALSERFAAEGMKVVMADVEATALDTAAAAVAFGAAHVVCNNKSIMHSSRNRPAELSEEGKAGPMAQAFGQSLADRLTRGYPPSEVADQVLHGIREKRFYVVPAQPEIREAVTIRAKDIIELRNPTTRR